MLSYDELKRTADQRWKDLTQGDMPWVRVGTEMNAHAAGGFQVSDAIPVSYTHLTLPTNREV